MRALVRCALRPLSHTHTRTHCGRVYSMQHTMRRSNVCSRHIQCNDTHPNPPFMRRWWAAWFGRVSFCVHPQRYSTARSPTHTRTHAFTHTHTHIYTHTARRGHALDEHSLSNGVDGCITRNNLTCRLRAPERASIQGRYVRDRPRHRARGTTHEWHWHHTSNINGHRRTPMLRASPRLAGCWHCWGRGPTERRRRARGRSCRGGVVEDPPQGGCGHPRSFWEATL